MTRILPEIVSGKIKRKTFSKIKEAIELGGTTIKSYTSSLGVTGRFQQKLMVHKREGEPCKICNSPLKKEFINGRSSYYCEKCQN